MRDVYCSDSIPNLFGIFDTTIAPTLLYYAYIPIIIISIFLGFYVYVKDRRSVSSSLLLLLGIFFSLHLVNELIQWIAADVSLVHFAWQISAITQTLVVFSAARFAYVFVSKKDVAEKEKIVGYILLLPIILLLGSRLNMSAFDLVNCEAVNGKLWLYVYGIQILAFIWVIIKLFLEQTDRDKHRKSNLLLIGIIALFGLFIGSNILGDITLVYNINLIGPLGMVIFLSVVSYVTVKYKQFDIKVFGAQVLVVAIWFLIFGILFIRHIENVRIVTLITLALFTIIGGALTRSVRKEVKAREEIQKLATELEQSNSQLESANERLKELDEQKSEFVSIASHQLRSPLTAIKGYSSMLLEGSFGKINEKANEAIDKIFQSSQRLVVIIEDFLNLSRIEQGRMQYEFGTVELRSLIETIIKEQEANAAERDLYLKFENDGDDYNVTADSGKARQVITNLIDNGIKYTKTGGITIKISKNDDQKKVLISITDTGMGIPPEVMPKLFQKFSRAAEAGKANIMGTGIGLFIAKQIMQAHKGSIWVDSDGAGKGSTFYLEFMAE